MSQNLGAVAADFLKICAGIDAVNQGNWSMSIKWRGEAFVIVDKNY